MNETQETTQDTTQDELICVAKIELMTLYATCSNTPLWVSQGGYTVEFSKLGMDIVGLFEGEGAGNDKHFKITTFTMKRSEFEALGDFEAWQ